MEDEPAPPASLVAHGRKNHRFDRWVTGPDRRTQASCSLRKTSLAAAAEGRFDVRPLRAKTPSTTIRRQP